MDFHVSADHRGKVKKVEKLDRYLYLSRELKKLKNIKATVIAIVDGALGTVHKSLEKRDLEI